MRIKYHDYETHLWSCALEDIVKIDNMVRSSLRNGWVIQGISVHHVLRASISILFTRGLTLEISQESYATCRLPVDLCVCDEI